jgi:hypothetical protein
MAALTEGRHPGECILTEGPGHYSREVLTILSGTGKVAANTVLGQITNAGASSAAKAGGNTGNGALTMDAVTPLLTGVQVGVYKVVCIEPATNGGIFAVTDPDGTMLGTVAVGATFSNEIRFAIADGATDFIAGDGFDITVAAGSGKWVPSANTGLDGSQIAKAVAIYDADATSGDAKVVALVRMSEVNGDMLAYHSSVDDANKRATKATQLAAAGIIVR